MNYEEFKNEANYDVLKMVNTAIKIFCNIKDSNINFYSKENRLDYFKTITVNKNDKKMLSLFLAGLKANDNIKNMFKEVRIEYDTMLKSINNYNSDKIKIDEHKEISYAKEYEENFADIIKKTCGDKSLDLMTAEEMLYKLTFYYKSRSFLIEGILIHEGIADARWLHASPVLVKLNSYSNNDLNSVSNSSTDIETLTPIINSFNNMSVLNKYGIVITDKDYKFNPAIGRDKEIEKVQVALLTDEVSPMLVGEAGVGKTAIVEGLAYRIKNGLVPSKIANMKIVKLNVSTLVAGCQYVGMFQERVESIISETMRNENVILFIDEIHSAIGAGAGSSKGQDLANILKPYIDRGDVTIIGSTTTKEYQEYIAEDPAFKRRFEKVHVPELGKKDLIRVVSGTIDKIEDATSVKWDVNADSKFNVINDIVDATSKEKRIYNDKVNNPDLVLKIVRKAFAYAELEDSDEVYTKHFPKALYSEDRLYEDSRKRTAANLIGKYDDQLMKENRDNVIPFPDSGKKV